MQILFIMKRQHDPSLFQNSSPTVESANVPSNKEKITSFPSYRKEFVEDWISKLPVLMHRIRKHHKKVKSNGDGDSEEMKESEEVDSILLEYNKSNKNHSPMDFAISTTYETKFENLNIKQPQQQHKPKCEILNLNRNSLKSFLEDDVSLEENQEDQEYFSSSSITSWKSIEDLPHHRNVFNLVDYPPNVVKYGESFKEFTDIERKWNEFFDVVVLEVNPPLNFWFFIDKQKWRKQTEQMANVYNAMKDDELRMVHTHVFPSQICAVPFEVGWARAIIRSYLMGSTVKVFLVDFGIEISIEPKILKYLKREFIEMPRLALRGTLAYIKPISLVDGRSLYKELYYGLISYSGHTAKLVKIQKGQDNKRVYHLDVYKRNSEISFSKYLVDKGYVECKNKKLDDRKR